MSTDRWMRASDEDREEVAGLLREAYVLGRLNREELDARSTAAYSARTWGELRDLTVDLPAQAAGGLPADSVAGRGGTRRPWAPMVWTCVLVLAAGLSGGITAGRCGSSPWPR